MKLFMFVPRMSDKKDTEKSKKTSSEDEEVDEEEEEEEGARSNISTQLSRSQHHPPAQSSSGVLPLPRPSTSKTRFSKHNIKFVPKEELVKQIMDMGICRNGAVKALYWTGNQSALAASNWIFDQPDRDLDTPLEDELEMIRAQQAEREREEREEREFASRICLHHHQHQHHHHVMDHSNEDLDEEDIDEEDLLEEEDDDDEEDEDIEEEDDDDDDMEFKMVFVVNRSLELRSGMMSLYVGKATAGLFRKINAQPQSVLVGPDELSMWGDLGEKMVALSAESDQHMKDLELMARNLRLPCQMIEIFVVS